MRVKVLFVIPTLDRCGAEKQLTLLATNLPKERFEVRVAVLTRDGPYSKLLREANVPVEIIGKKGKLSIGAYLKLKKLIKKFRPDIVHTWIFAANSYGRRAAFACNVPVVICGERCLDPWKSPWQGWIDKKLEPKTDAYIVNSSGIVDFYVKRGIPQKKFIVIPNAIQAPSSSEVDRTALKESLLKELGISSVRPEVKFPKNRIFDEMNISGSNSSSESQTPSLIGLVARFWPQKRIKDALWAADQMKFAQVNFYLVVIGDGPERDSLLRYREDLQLSDRVIFLGERDDVVRFMPCFDVLWNCSAYEGQSNSILEAQSFGVPVVASDVPGNRDLVITGETGLLISEFDGDETRRRTAFSRETMRLLKSENDELRQTLGNNAKRRVQEFFSLEKNIARHVEVYERLLEEKQSSR